jgi:hypothetical protein
VQCYLCLTGPGERTTPSLTIFPESFGDWRGIVHATVNTTSLVPFGQKDCSRLSIGQPSPFSVQPLMLSVIEGPSATKRTQP